jgi:hypothetical protein
MIKIGTNDEDPDADFGLGVTWTLSDGRTTGVEVWESDVTI